MKLMGLTILIYFFIPGFLTTPTIEPISEFYPELDAEDLHDALTAKHVKEDLIQEILSDRSCAQRQKIQEAYDKRYHEVKLFKSIHRQLQGTYETIMKCMFFCDEQLLAVFFQKAMKYGKRDWNKYEKNHLTGQRSYKLTRFDPRSFIMACETEDTKQKFKNYFYDRYHVEMVDKLSTKLASDLKNVCVEMMTRVRSYETPQNGTNAADIAQRMKEERPKWGDSRTELDVALNEYPLNFTKQIFLEFIKVNNGNNLIHAIHKFGQEKRHIYRDYINFINDSLSYYAEEYYNAVDDAGTDEDALMLLTLYESERNIVEIVKRFHEMYPKNAELPKKIDSDVSGAFERLLLSFFPLTDEQLKVKLEKRQARLEDYRRRNETTTIPTNKN